MPSLTTIFRFTTPLATVLFVGCSAGRGIDGTALLQRFSQQWPTKTFVAFTTIGVAPGGLMHRARNGEGLDTEAGMRDSEYVYSPGPNHDYTTTLSRSHPGMTEWESYHWASETSEHAKVIRDGSFIRFPEVNPAAGVRIEGNQ
jgi:hypothetical protein